jgi:hypothetical protein
MVPGAVGIDKGMPNRTNVHGSKRLAAQERHGGGASADAKRARGCQTDAACSAIARLPGAAGGLTLALFL